MLISGFQQNNLLFHSIHNKFRGTDRPLGQTCCTQINGIITHQILFRSMCNEKLISQSARIMRWRGSMGEKIILY